ncbi:MAG: hypothetical protein JJV99_02230 [Colwellia sp.]|nr:hypothetical protein [Colwellia sp.]
MFKYAQIQNNIVVGLQESSREIFSPDLVIVKGLVNLGDNYLNKKFSPVVVVAEQIRAIAPIAFRDRFTFDERVLITASQNPKVKTFEKDLETRRRHLSLDSPRLVLAMQLLLSENIIALGRDVVLLGDGSQDEKF